jgi:hypothetical protein
MWHRRSIVVPSRRLSDSSRLSHRTWALNLATTGPPADQSVYPYVCSILFWAGILAKLVKAHSAVACSFTGSRFAPAISATLRIRT